MECVETPDRQVPTSIHPIGHMTDMDTTMTSFQAGLEPFIDMDKGDFIGRAALVAAGHPPFTGGVARKQPES